METLLDSIDSEHTVLLPRIQAEIIAVGSELLTSSHLDTNSLFITQQLNELGIEVIRKSVIGDRSEEIKRALNAGLKAAEIIVVTGGLGPTNDDITRETVAETLGRNLCLDSDILEKMEERYKQTRLSKIKSNQRQAMVPEGAQSLDNLNGTAPGLFLKEDQVLIFLLPGPPRELKPMMVDLVVPLVREHKQTSRQFYRRLKVAAAGESQVDSSIGPIYKSYPLIETTILSSPGNLELSFNWIGEPEKRVAESQLEELVGRVRDELGESVFTDRDEHLEEVVGQVLREKGLTLATAESCTGGLVGKMVTDVSGSSEYYLGGVVSYNNNFKVDWLGVNETTLERFGAVSESVAEQMAIGIRKRTGADIGLSTTGVAGPEGGSPEKPVGLIFIGVSGPQGNQTQRLQFPGPRDTVRIRTARFALDLVRRSLL